MTFTVPPEQAGARLDVALSVLASLSRSAAERLIGEGAVTVNGRPAAKKTPVQAGDVLEATLPDVRETEVRPQPLPLCIVYQDADIAVLNKPQGMVVHPAPGNEDGTLVNALLYHIHDLSGIGGELRPGIVHRLDKDTSGLLVVAKNDEAHQNLSAQMEHHGVWREYRALVQGGFRDDAGTIDLPIGRHPTDRKKMAVLHTGHIRQAVTHYQVLERFGEVTYLALRLETGRTHQIRVHLSTLGHPLLGDTVYGGGTTRFEKQHAALFHGQALHAGRLTFLHPRTGEEMTFTAPLPENFEHALSLLRANAQS